MFALAHAHAKGHVRTGFESLQPLTKKIPHLWWGIFFVAEMERFELLETCKMRKMACVRSIENKGFSALSVKWV